MCWNTALEKPMTDATDTSSDAAQAVARNLDAAKVRANQAADYLTLSINADPVKAMLVTAAISALLTGLLIALTGGRR